MLEIKIVETLDELLEAGKLIHKRYTEVGYITHNRYQCFLNTFHFNDATTTFIAHVGGNILATLAVVEKSKIGLLPCELLYDIEIEDMSCEIIGFASIGILRVTFGLLDFVIDWGINLGIDYAYIEVNPKHENFYENFLGFKKILENNKASIGTIESVLFKNSVIDISRNIKYIIGGKDG